MIRVPTPPGHNDTTMSYKRSTTEGALCFGDDCKPYEVYKSMSYFEFVVYVLIACICIGFIVVPLAKKPYTEVQTVADKPATTPCGNGFSTEWIDDFSIECKKETR